MKKNGKRMAAILLVILFCCTGMRIDPAFAAVNELEALAEEATELVLSAESETEEAKAEESETKDEKNEAEETSADAAEESTEETEAVRVDSSAHGAAGDHTADEAIAWLNSVNGQGLDMDGAYGPQCVDLIVAYQDFLGVGTRVWGNAKDYAYKDIPGCTRIAGATPQKGDILIFTGGGGGYGHVAIFESEYRSWDQNGSQGQVVGVHNLHWTNMGQGYYGVIRPNFRTVPQNRQPRGAVDLIETGTGTLRVAGWAVDDDSPDAAIGVHIYVGDCAREGSTAEQFAITANKYRSDVGNHSFDETLDVSKVGNQRICVYLIDANVNDNPCKFDGYRTIGEGVPLSSGSRAVPDGYYQIVSAIDEEYELDVDGTNSFSAAPNVQLWKNRNEKMDVFYLTYDNGFYEIKHTLSGKCLDVEGGSRANKANVQAHSDNDSVAQRWAVKPNGRYWNIEAKCSGYRLDAFGGKVFSDKTTNVCVHRANDSDAQKWRLIPFAPNEKRTLEDGNYHIVSRMDGETKGLHVSGTSGDFRNVTAEANLLDPNQVFLVTYESSTGAYILKHRSTSLFLEVESSGTKQNIGVATGDTSGKVDGDWKRWVLKKDASGYYGIVSLKTGEGIYYNPRNNGNVTCDTCNLTYTDQHFKFLRAVDGVSLNTSAITLTKDETRTLSAAVVPADAANQNVTWSSDKTSVATVDTNGRVSAKAEGTANITVTTEDGGKQAVCTITVKKAEAEPVAVTGVSLNKTKAVLEIGQTITLTESVAPDNADNKEVSWSSDKTTVARVDASGKVTAIAAGTATITVTTEDGGKTASCTVTVKAKEDEPEPTPTPEPEPTPTPEPEPTPTPEPAAEKFTVIFYSGDDEIYREQVVSGDTVTNVPEAAGSGTFVGWFTMEDNLWDQTMPVLRNMLLEARFLGTDQEEQEKKHSGLDPDLAIQNEADCYMVKGQSAVLDSSRVWTSDLPKIVSVSGKYKLNAKSVGKAVVASGDESYNVYVVQPALKLMNEETKSLETVKAATVVVGNTIELSVGDLGSYDASTASWEYEDSYDVTWQSSNTEVAKVDNGLVYGAAKGSAKITAYICGKAYTCNVTVKDTHTVSQYDGTISLSPLQTVTVKYKDGFNVKNGVWSSNQDMQTAYKGQKVDYYQDKVVRITPAGKLTAAGVGTTELTVTNDGESRSFTVTVAAPTQTSIYLNGGKSKTIKYYNVKTSGKQAAAWTIASAEEGKTYATVTQKGVVKAAAGVTGKSIVTCIYDPYGTGGFTYTTAVYTENPSIVTTDSRMTKKDKTAETKSAVLSLKVGDTFPLQIEGSLKPALFVSNKNAVAFVDEAGVVSARGKGKANLTARINGTKYTVQVVVSE